MTTPLAEALELTTALHRHLCPRQVLGTRMGLYAGKLLGLDLPQRDKRLFTFVETDGCFADGVGAATGCWLGRRTMRLIDYGKVAATFVDTLTMQAIRIHPRPDSRQLAAACQPDARSRWHGQLIAYQEIADEALLIAREVRLSVDMAALISQPGLRVTCDNCGEEVMNQREVELDGQTLCRSCADGAYYHTR